MVQVEVTIRVTGAEEEVGALVSEMLTNTAARRTEAVNYPDAPLRERDPRGLVEAMRDELTQGARKVLKEIAEHSLLGNGRAYSRRVRSELGGISPAALAGSLGPVTAFARRHNWSPFTRRWDGNDTVYQVEETVATLIVELL